MYGSISRHDSRSIGALASDVGTVKDASSVYPVVAIPRRWMRFGSTSCTE